jgi:phage baseplate assembly protein W
MAIEVGNIPAFDQFPIQGIGLSVPFKNSFTMGSAGGSDPIFQTNYTTSNQVKYNLVNFFLTKQGERVFNPNFGSQINNFLFEPNNLSTPQIIENIIKEEIQTIFPVIKLKQVKVGTNFDDYTLTIQIFYSVFSSLNESLELNIPL